MRFYLIWFAANTILAIYIAVLLSIFQGSWDLGCVRKLMVWLAVYNLLAGLHMVRTLIIVCVWRKSMDPAQTQIYIELLYGMWIFLAEAAWLIYGNTFIYDEEIKDCDKTFAFKWANVDLDTTTLRNTALALVIYGYLLFFVIFLVILFYIGLYFGYKSYIKQDLASKEANDQFDASNKTQEFIRE